VLVAKKYIDPQIRIIFIPEFNNFFEESYLEPNTLDNFTFLEILKEVTSGS
jgi:hypothetical protein